MTPFWGRDGKNAALIALVWLLFIVIVAGGFIAKHWLGLAVLWVLAR